MGKVARLAAVLLAWSCPAVARAALPFFAPPQPTGALQVKLYPMENVAAGVQTLVTFGLPLTRGSLAPADLTRVRVLRGGVEVPAHVSLLVPWRHATSPGQDGTSVRVARVQVRHTFATTFPGFETVTVEWGLAPRALDVPAAVDPRTAWHRVTSGSFASADNVFEPDVYAVLPAAHLAQGVLRPTRSEPFRPGVPENREDPALMDSILTWPGFEEQEHASKNNLYSVVNQDDPLVTPPNQCPYKTDSEPWLYDRASAMFAVYFRSGFLKPLREAVRHTDFYRTQIYPAGTTPANAVGAFRLKVPDPAGYIGGNGAMYSYNESFAYTHWLTGDAAVLPYVPWIVNAHEANDEPTRWTPTLGGWTERHTAFRLLANVVAFEVTGGAAYRASLLSQSGDFIWHQNGAGGALPANRIDGGLYHYGSQHGDGTPDQLVASSWMTALTADAMVRAYAVTEDPAIGGFVRRVGTFEKVATKTDAGHLYGGGALAYADYMMRFDGASDERDGSEVEHALEVASTLAWAGYFAELLGAPDPTLHQAAASLYRTYDVGVNYWIRPAAPQSGLTAFRVSPWRKFGWEHRTSGSLSWLMAPPAATAGAAFAQAATTAGEGSGSVASTVRVTTSDGSVLAGPLTVSWATANGTAVAGADFTAASGVLTFAAGSASGATQSVSVTLLQDVLDEPAETFTIALAGVVGGGIGTPGVHTVTLTDDDPPPVLAVGDQTVAEPDCASGTAAFTVTLAPVSGLPVTVQYATASGTAVEGADYTAVAGVLTFAPGTTTRTVSVPILDDLVPEPVETFRVDLTAPGNATLGDPQAAGTITDADGAAGADGELSHGVVVEADLAAAPGPSADEDLFLLAQQPYASYEIVADAASGDVSPLALERVDCAGGAVLQSSVPVGTGSARSLRWQAVPAGAANQRIRVRSGECGTGCGADDRYRLRVWETTYRVARFNNVGSQGTVLIVQNPGHQAVGATARFWSPSGGLLGQQLFTLAPHGSLVLNTATVAGVAGQSGSVTVTHDAPYGALAGKTVALEPATGYSFDSPLLPRSR